MEYERISDEYREGNDGKIKVNPVKDKSLDFFLKALDSQEFEMPAVCH